MKKILSVALSTAMAFSMFASVAFGETATTPQQKFDALAAKGILNGYPDGQAHLEKDLTRAEFAKIVTKLFDLSEVKNKLSYKDKGYNANNWAVPYIEAVTAANLMQGKDTVKGIFDYNGKVTVEEVAAVLFRALKLEAPTTTDNNASVWAKGYVQAVINKGLMAQNVNFKGNATRSLVVEAAYAVETLTAAPVVASAEALSPTSVLVTFADKTTTTVTLTTPLVPGTETAINFEYKGFKLTTKVTLAAPKVVSVTNPTAKQLVVKFNRAIDKGTVIAADGTLVDGIIEVLPVNSAPGVAIDTARASLSADATELWITPAGSKYFNGQYSFTLKKETAKTSAGDFIPTFTTLLNVNDTTAPTFVSATAVGRTNTNTVTVKLSEPVQTAGVIAYINGVAATVTPRSADAALDELVLTSSQSLATGTTFELSLLNVKDFAENFISPNPYKANFTVSADVVVPAVTSVVVTGERTVDVTFNKKVTSASVASAASLIGANGVTYSFTSTGTNDNTVSLETSAPLSFTNNSFTGVFVLNTGVVDALGNKMAAQFSQAISFAKDVAAPTVASVTYGSTGIVVTFSENVVYSTGATTGTLAAGTASLINEATGAVVTLDGSAFSISNKTLTIAKQLSAGNYTLRLATGFVKDKASAPNNLAAYVGSFTATATASSDTKAPEFEGTTVENVKYLTITNSGTNTDAEQLVKYTVSDPNGIDVASVRDVNNYTLKGKALPAGTYITTEGVSTTNRSNPVEVTIHIPSAGITTTDDDYVLVVSNVKDTAGNTATPIISSKFALREGVKPTLASAVISAGDSNTLVVGFSEDVTGVTTTSLTINLNNVDVSRAARIELVTSGTDKGKYNVSFATVARGGKLYVDVPGGTSVEVGTTTAADGPTDAKLNLNSGAVTSLTVSINGTTIKDIYGNEIVAGGSIAVK